MKSFEVLKKARRWRWLLYLALLLLLYVTVLSRFRYQRLDYDPMGAMAPAVLHGKRHLIDLDPALKLERDWIVIWQDYEDTLRTARVAVLPGERMRREDGRWFAEGSQREKILLKRGLELDTTWLGRLLGDDEYLLLNDQLQRHSPDSRMTGPIRRRRIIAHVLFRFGSDS